MNRLKENIWAQLFVIYTRYLIGGAFVFASLIKIKGHRFTGDSGADHAIDTAWHFFETMYQSGLYWQFIGVAQLVAGFLLMTQRYAKLGALIYFPIVTNIFVITLSYYFGFTPVITGLLLLANLMLICWDWDDLRVIINLPQINFKSIGLEKDKVWEVTGLALFLFTFLYRTFVNKYDIFLWGGVCIVIGLVGLVFGWRRRTKYNSS